MKDAARRGAVIAAAAIVLSASWSSPARAQEYRGDLIGRIIDSRTLEPVPGAHVLIVEKPGIGAAADSDGRFSIRGVAAARYSIRISAVGYESKVVTDVVVVTGRATPLRIPLEQTSIEAGEVTAEGTYFERARGLSPLSANTVDRSEVLRSPGGVQDVQRVIQNLPGVASSTDNINELIVRGGAPFENLTILDNMEIPSINHYSNQYNSAGPINMVNADMIEDVQFSSGGFPARYGDKTSSVMDLSVREGNRDRAFASKTVINFAGAGTLVEGGFADGKGSYIFSARLSLLEIIDKLVGLSTLSLTSVPKYWDTQGKVVYDLSPSQKLSLNLLYGDSRIYIDGDPKGTDPLRKNTIDSSSVDILYPRTRQYAAGLNLRSLYGADGYSLLTLYASGTNSNVDITRNFDVRPRGPAGEVLSTTTLSATNVFTNDYVDGFVGAKFDLLYRVHPQHEISAGAQFLTTSNWRNNVFVAADTARYDLDRSGMFATGPVVVPAGMTSQNFRFGEVSKYYMYASDRVAVTPSVSLTAGVRYDFFTYAGRGSLSPRGSISWEAVPSSSTITFALGEYYQTQPLPYYWDQRDIGYNRSLTDMKADHYVLGADQILGRGLRLRLETYYKKYTQTAVSEQFLYPPGDTLWSDRWLTIGQRTSYGLELLLEQKQVEDYFGTLSLSLSRSREKDPRAFAPSSTYPSDYDYPVILTLISGTVLRGVKDWLNDAPFFLKFPSYLLPLSNDMEISFKYRYQTGRPYTPESYVTWKQTREGGVRWSSGAWIESVDYNSARYPAYGRLDLQWLSRFYFQNWNINAYVAMMNVLNRKNVFYQNYRSDGTVETIYQFAFFPVVGFEAEF